MELDEQTVSVETKLAKLTGRVLLQAISALLGAHRSGVLLPNPVTIPHSDRQQLAMIPPYRVDDPTWNSMVDTLRGNGVQTTVQSPDPGTYRIYLKGSHLYEGLAKSLPAMKEQSSPTKQEEKSKDVELDEDAQREADKAYRQQNVGKLPMAERFEAAAKESKYRQAHKKNKRKQQDKEMERGQSR